MATFCTSLILLSLIGLSSVLSDEVNPDSYSPCPRGKRLRRGAGHKVLLVSPEKPELAQEVGYPYALNYDYSKLSRTSEPDIHVVIGGGGGGGGAGGIYIHGDLGAVLPGNSPSSGGSFGGGGGGGFSPKYYTVHRAHGIYSGRPEPTELIYGQPTYRKVDYKNIDPSDVPEIKPGQREFTFRGGPPVQGKLPGVVTDNTNKRVYFSEIPNQEDIGTGRPAYLEKSDYHSHPEEIANNGYLKKIILGRDPASNNDGYGEAHRPLVQIQTAPGQHVNPQFHLYSPEHEQPHKEFHILTNNPKTSHFQTNSNQGSIHHDLFPIEKAPATHLIIAAEHLVPSTNGDLLVNRQYSNVHDHHFDQGVHKDEGFQNHYIYQKEYPDVPSYVNYQVVAGEREKYPVISQIKLNGQSSLKETQGSSFSGVEQKTGYINIGNEEPSAKSPHLLQGILIPRTENLNYGVKLVREPKSKSSPDQQSRNKNLDLISRELIENTDVYGSNLKNNNDSLKNQQDSKSIALTRTSSTQSGSKQTGFPKNIHTSVN